MIPFASAKRSLCAMEFMTTSPIVRLKIYVGTLESAKAFAREDAEQCEIDAIILSYRSEYRTRSTLSFEVRF